MPSFSNKLKKGRWHAIFNLPELSATTNFLFFRWRMKSVNSSGLNSQISSLRGLDELFVNPASFCLIDLRILNNPPESSGEKEHLEEKETESGDEEISVEFVIDSELAGFNFVFFQLRDFLVDLP